MISYQSTYINIHIYKYNININKRVYLFFKRDIM